MGHTKNYTLGKVSPKALSLSGTFRHSPTIVPLPVEAESFRTHPSSREIGPLALLAVTGERQPTESFQPEILGKSWSHGELSLWCANLFRMAPAPYTELRPREKSFLLAFFLFFFQRAVPHLELSIYQCPDENV